MTKQDHLFLPLPDSMELKLCCYKFMKVMQDGGSVFGLSMWSLRTIFQKYALDPLKQKF